MSPRASVATVVIPMRTGETELSTHSCSAVYFRSGRIVATKISFGSVGLRTTVERTLDDRERFTPAADVGLELGADLRGGRVDEGQGDRAPEGRARQARGHGPDPLAVAEDGGTLTRRAPPLPGEPDEYPAPGLTREVGLADPLQRLPADEVRRLALEPDDAAQPHRERVDVAAELVAVERHRRLQPQRVPGGEAGGHEVVGRAEQLVPERHRVLGRQEDLEAVLPGVPGSGEQDVDAAEGGPASSVVAEVGDRLGREPADDLHRPRPLDREQRRR